MKKKSSTDCEDNLDIIQLEGSKLSHVTFDEQEIKASACKSSKHEENEQPFRYECYIECKMYCIKWSKPSTLTFQG